MEQYLVFSVLGSDRPGLVNQISQEITRQGGNIIDTRMAVLGGELALIMLISGSWDSIAKLENLLPALIKQLGLTSLLKRTALKNRTLKALPYQVQVVALDHPGIVAEIAGFFSERRQWHGVEDYDMWLKLAKNGCKFYFLKEVLGEYILHDDNMTVDMIGFNKRILDVSEYHFSQIPNPSLYYRYLMNKKRSKLHRNTAFLFIKTGNNHSAKTEAITSFNLNPFSIKTLLVFLMGLVVGLLPSKTGK